MTAISKLVVLVLGCLLGCNRPPVKPPQGAEMNRPMNPLASSRVIAWSLDDEDDARRIPAVAPSIEVPTQPEFGSLLYPFGTPRQSGRMAHPAAHGPLELAWSKPLPEVKWPPIGNPAFAMVLGHRNRVVVQSRPVTHIYTDTGRHLATHEVYGNGYAGNPGNGAAGFIDPATNVLYAPGLLTYTRKIHLGTGLRGPGWVNAALTMGDKGYRAEFLSPLGDGILAIYTLSDNTEQNAGWQTEGIVVRANRSFAGFFDGGSSHVAVALDSGGAVVATREGLVWTDQYLRPTQEIVRKNFLVHRVSVGDDDSVYAVVHVDDASELWRIAPSGKLMYRVGIGDYGALPYPPATLPDGSAFVATRSEIIAISPEGGTRWRAPCGCSAPLLLTSDGYISTISRTSALLFDPEGKPEIVWTLPEIPISAPTYVDGEHVYVVGETTLYALKRR